MRTPGYNLTIKLFIPAPKSDFKAQANAAEMAGQAVDSGTITPELLAAATVLEVKGNYGSADLPETPPTPDPNAPPAGGEGRAGPDSPNGTPNPDPEKTGRKGRQSE